MHRLFAAILVALTVSGCGGPYDGRTFHYQEVSFVLPPPGEGWRRVEISETALTFAGEGGTMQASGSCRSNADVPLPTLRNHLLIGFTARQLEDEQLVTMRDREALDSRLHATLDGVPVFLRIVNLKKHGCAYAFVLTVNEDARIGSHERTFERWIGSFAEE